MRPIACALPFLVTLASCAATPIRGKDEISAIATVQSFFDAMEARDAELARSLVVSDGVFVSTRRTEAGPSTRATALAAWPAMLESGDSHLFEAFDGEPLVRVDGDVAIVWGRYTFDVDGERSHTGVDAVTLVRTDDGWRIAGGAYSVVQPTP